MSEFDIVSNLAVWCYQVFYSERHDSSNFATHRANFWTEAAREPLHLASYVTRTGTGSPWPSVTTDGVTRKVHLANQSTGTIHNDTSANKDNSFRNHIR